MLDAVNLERRGVPVVVIAHDLFERAAKTQARVLNMPDLALVITPRPLATWGVPEMLEHDPTLVERVHEALNARIARTAAAG